MMLFMVATLQSVRAQGTCTAMTADDLYTAVKNNQTVTLGNDIALSNGRLDISGTTATLDLNGHTLTRPMTAADAGGQVIAVMNGGKLTITDSSGSNSGTITGGWAYQGSGIYVYEGCSLTINGGTITGNRSDQIAEGGFGYGGGVENHGTMTITGGNITGNTAGQFGGGIHNEGTLTITGGTIAGNTAGTYGGAIYSNSTVGISGATLSGNKAQSGGGAICSEGTLTLDGVTITGNQAQNGGGIYLFGTGTAQLKGESTITGNTAQTGGGIFMTADGATLKMQDKPVVQDNTTDNVHLQSYQLITVSGAFSEGARIGVSTEAEQSAFTAGYSTYNPGMAPSTYFFVSSAVIAGDVVLSGSEAGIQQTGYKYIDHTWNQSTKTLTTEEKSKTAGEYTVLGNNDGWTALTDNGWFVVDGEIAIGALAVSGTSNLILCDGARLTVTEGVKVESKSNAVLNIYGQAGNSGQLIATNSHDGAAGIGSGGSSDDGDAGRINIHGGTITATGNKYAAGIGGGDNHGFDRTNVKGGLTVYGGNVTAHGGEYAAGIGSGDEPGTDNGAYAGYVTIYGGTVTAYGGKEAAGIGGGNEGHGAMFSIYGGTVTASGGPKGAGIGGGDEGDCNRVEINGGTVTATSYSDTYYRDNCAAAIGSGYGGRYCEVTINGGTVNAKADGQGPGIGRGDASSSYDENKKMFITITGGDVTATSNYYGAGIGSGAKTKFYGKIEISGGKVTATGYNGGAGIGTGTTLNEISADMYGSILISGGEVNARGYANIQTSHGYIGGAGIGSGAAGTIHENARIEITGGNVTAVSTSGGGIGAGGAKNLDTSDYPYQFSKAKCSITIGGDNTTLRLRPGYIDEYASEAIMFGTNANGTLNISGQLAVSVNGTTCTADNRVSTLQSKSNVEVDPCTHNGAYTIDNATQHHHGDCTYCGAGSTTTEDHVFADNGKCVCGLVALKDMADNASVLSTWNEKTVPVSLDGRTLYKDGSWNTLCLPFAVNDFTGTPLEGATVKSLSTTAFADGTLTLTFSDASKIEAGKPYLVKWTAQNPNTVANPVFNDVTISKTTTDVKTNEVTFKGIFSPYAISGEDKTMLYLDTDNKLCYPNTAMTIGSCRAYFQLADGLTAGESSTAGAKGISHIVLNFGDGVATGVTTPLALRRGVGGEAWYSLDGRRLTGKPAQKGIYLYKGKKIVIK